MCMSALTVTGRISLAVAESKGCPSYPAYTLANRKAAEAHEAMQGATCTGDHLSLYLRTIMSGQLLPAHLESCYRPG